MVFVKKIAVSCSCILLVILSMLPVASATDEEVYYEYDSSGKVISYIEPFESVDSDFNYAVNMLGTSEPNYPSWSPDSIPWASFPLYIRELAFPIIYNISLYSYSDYRLAPFVMVRVGSSNYEIFIGQNVFLGVNTYRSLARICSNSSWVKAPVLYHATFLKSDNSVVSSWEEVTDTTAFQYNDQQYFYFNNCYINFDSTRDFYLYGTNFFPDKLSGTLNIYYSDYDLSDKYICNFNNSGLGIFSDSSRGASWYSKYIPNAYFSYFTPVGSDNNTVSGVTDFGLNDVIRSSSYFKLLDDLPYGDETIVLSYAIRDVVYHFFASEDDDVKIVHRFSASNPNQLQFCVFSKKTVYRIGYSRNSGGYISCDGAVGLSLCSDKGSSTVSSPASGVFAFYHSLGYKVYYYTFIAGSVNCTISSNNSNLTILNDGIFSYKFGDYPDSKFYSSIDNSAVGDMNAAESALFTSNYNPDNFANDFQVPLDGAAVNAVFAVMDSFVQIDETVFGGVLIVLVLGVIALIFNR